MHFELPSSKTLKENHQIYLYSIDFQCVKNLKHARQKFICSFCMDFTFFFFPFFLFVFLPFLDKREKNI